MAAWRARWCDPTKPGVDLDPIAERARRANRPNPFERLRNRLDQLWPDVGEVVEARRLIEAHGVIGYRALRGDPPEVLLDAIDEMAAVEARLEYVTRLRMARLERRKAKA